MKFFTQRLIFHFCLQSGIFQVLKLCFTSFVILHRLLWIRKMKETFISFTLHVKTPQRFPEQPIRRRKWLFARPPEVYLRHKERGFRLLRTRASSCPRPGNSKIGQINFCLFVCFCKQKGKDTHNRHNVSFSHILNVAGPVCVLTCLFLYRKAPRSILH